MSLDLPRIKVCGLTSAADARHAVAAGADALGFVHFAPSPRHVNADSLTRLRDELEGLACARVLVLVDADPDQALALAERAGCTHVQLTGRADARDWSAFPLPILRGVGVDSAAAAEIEAWSAAADLFVLDHPSGPGGTGCVVDTHTARCLAASAPVLLAGGLDATNVGRFVDAIRPHGVDASSRLESQPGRKDPAAVTAFVHSAALALADLR